MDKLLKQHLMDWFGVKQRTLQTWLRAGLVPGTTRTKKGCGHYRIRAPKGMKPELYHRALGVFTGTGDPLKKCAEAGLPLSFWLWQQRVAYNVGVYQRTMRDVRRACRVHGLGAPPVYTLGGLKAASRRSTPRRPTLSQ